MRAMSVTNIPKWLNENRGTTLMSRILICLAALGLGGCLAIGDSGLPIASETVAAPLASAQRTLVIMLPGFGDDVQEMRDHGVARAIQDAWPEADVLLASATYAYYRDGQLVPRLHDEVVAPALRAGYRVWLAGASMGGMGVLLYEREHPGTLTGVVLFAPYLGSDGLLKEIRAAGGPRDWDPGPVPAEMTRENYQRQVWKMVKGWADRPDLAHRVWLVCGTDDPLMSDARLLAAALPENRFMEIPGGHTWSALLSGGRSVFSRIRRESLDGKTLGLNNL
jgi:pimeloyl-ACP methyl ester carboxylesterase